MMSNRAAFAALGVACITAAAGGGYFASRQAPVVPASTVAAVDAAPPIDPAARPAEAAHAVEETETVLTPEPSPSPRTTVAPKPLPTPAARVATPARPAARPRTETPVLERTWPSGAAASSAAASATPPTAPETAAPSVESAQATVARDEERAPEPPPAPEKIFEELVVATDSVIGLQTETLVSSEQAKVEDRVEARVTRDVRVGEQIAIPAGTRALGSVMQVERGGKFKERARLGIRFHTLVLADGTRVQINTETIYREGAAPGNASAAKIGGGAVGGAILGAILGGAKGAVIGATTGAGAGTAAVVVADRNAATLPAGTPMTVRILAPVTVTVEH
jgi:type IV secretory pathway VirB10-like protein